MNDVVAQNSFENLTQSGLLRITSKDDRNVSMSIDTFGGNTSLCVFTGSGGRPWKVGLPRKIIWFIKTILDTMRREPKPCRKSIFLNKFEEGDGKKKYVQYGCLGFGIDDNLTLYIDVAANDLQGRHMFPIKLDGRFDLTQSELSEKDILLSMINYVSEAFQELSAISERVSSFKRSNQGGGNKGYSGGGGNRSGGYNNNNNNNRSPTTPPAQQSTFGGGPDIENDLYV